MSQDTLAPIDCSSLHPTADAFADARNGVELDEVMRFKQDFEAHPGNYLPSPFTILLRWSLLVVLALGLPGSLIIAVTSFEFWWNLFTVLFHLYFSLMIIYVTAFCFPQRFSFAYARKITRHNLPILQELPRTFDSANSKRTAREQHIVSDWKNVYVARVVERIHLTNVFFEQWNTYLDAIRLELTPLQNEPVKTHVHARITKLWLEMNRATHRAEFLVKHYGIHIPPKKQEELFASLDTMISEEEQIAMVDGLQTLMQPLQQPSRDEPPAASAPEDVHAPISERIAIAQTPHERDS
jgi:hypothetical protein